MNAANLQAPELPGVPLKEATFYFPGQPIRIWVPADPMALAGPATKESDAGEEREVYWAEIWPAGVAMAEALLTEEVVLGRTEHPVLELGCGAGLAAVAAGMMLEKAAGRAVCGYVASDSEPRSLALTQANLRRTGVAERVGTRLVNWDRPQEYDARHDLVLGADLLYRPDGGAGLCVFLRQVLSGPGARAILVDPNRWSARQFAYTAADAGFQVESATREVPFTSRLGPVMEMPRSGPPSDTQNPHDPIEVTFYELTLR